MKSSTSVTQNIFEFLNTLSGFDHWWDSISKVDRHNITYEVSEMIRKFNKEQVEDATSTLRKIEAHIERLVKASILYEYLAEKHPHHEISKACPGCGQDIHDTGITGLVYTFEACNCGTPDYTHLVETIWHKRCFVAKHYGDRE